MLTLDTIIKIPSKVAFSFVEQEAVLLNKQTNQYYRLDEVGARLWSLLQGGKSLRESHPILLEDYEVDPIQLEQDILELADDLLNHGLLEIVQL
jgi:hypothetical protein